MKNPSLPLTGEQSRIARQRLGLSQAEVIKQSELPAHKLKHFETGRMVPDMSFLQQLGDFYTALGIDLAACFPAGVPAPEPTPAADLKPGASMIRTVQRPCFYVSETVSTDLLDQCLERMHQNDERIAALLKVSLKGALLGGHHDDTIAEHQELFGAMAENYLIFRLLQGNPIVQPADGSTTSPATHADLLGQFYAKSPVVTGEPVAPAPAKASSIKTVLSPKDPAPADDGEEDAE